MASSSAAHRVQDDHCLSTVAHTDNQWETYYGDVQWGLPFLCPHSQGTSASRLMRLLAQRTHTACTSQALPVSTRDRRVARTLPPTPSSASSTPSIFTHFTTSTPSTTPPSSPFKSTQSLLTSKDPSLRSCDTKTRWFECGKHLCLCHSRYAKPPHHHTSLLRTSLPRRKGNFRKVSHKAIDFFREEMSRHGRFSRPCFPITYSLGDARSSIAVNVAESTLRSYEACAGFFGWRGLGLSESVYSDPPNFQPPIGIRRRVRSRRRTLDTLISDEEVEEGRTRWLEMVKEIVGPVPFRARHSKISQPGAVHAQSQSSTGGSDLTRPALTKNKGVSPLREDGLGFKDPVWGWQCSTPVPSSAGSARTPLAYQSVPHHASSLGLGYSQVVGSGHGNLHTSARCASRGKDELSSTSESIPHLPRKPDSHSHLPMDCTPQSASRPNHSLRPKGTPGKDGDDFQGRNVASNGAPRPADRLDSPNQSTSRSHKPEAIPAHSQTSMGAQTPMFPALNGGYVQDSTRRIPPRRESVLSAGSDGTGREFDANRSRSNGHRSEQEERSTCSSPSPSLRASAGSPSNNVGLRKDAQGFWEPVTPPCSPPDRGRGAASGRSRGSAAESPSSSSSSPDSILTSTPASVASSTTSPPPDSPGSCFSPESQNALESFDSPSLLPAFFASAAKRKREKASRTREIVDRLKLGSGGEDDCGSDGRPALDAGGGSTGKASLLSSMIDWTTNDVDELGDKTPSRPPSQQKGTAIHNGSPDRQSTVSASSKPSPVPLMTPEAVVDLKTPPATAKVNPDSLTKPPAPISSNGWAAPSGAGMHGRSASSVHGNRTACAMPVPPSTAPATTTTFQASAPPFLQPPPAPHVIPPAGLCIPPPPPPPVPVVRIPAQQQPPVVFYGPTYPMYTYPVVPPPPPQSIGRGQGQPPWLVGYRPPQGGIHPPVQATPITGVSGMRHVGW